MTIAVIIVLPEIACASYGDSDISGTSINSLNKHNKMLLDAVTGVHITLEQGSNHVLEDQNINWLNIPLSYGRHWRGSADCGFYTQSLLDERIIHNFEHRYLVISCDLANPAKVTETPDSL